MMGYRYEEAVQENSELRNPTPEESKTNKETTQ